LKRRETAPDALAAPPSPRKRQSQRRALSPLAARPLPTALTPSSLPCPTRGRGRVGSPREGKSGQPGRPPRVSRLAPPLKGRASRNRLAPPSPCPAEPAGRAGRRPPAAHPLPAGRVPSPHRPVALAVALPCPRKRKSRQTACRPDVRPPSPHCHGSPRDQFSPVCVILLAMSKGCSFSKSILRSWGGDRAKNNHKEEEESLTGLHRPFRPSRFKMANTGRSCTSCMVHHEGPELITQRSERRLAIEKLLLQETFSSMGDMLAQSWLIWVTPCQEEGEEDGKQTDRLIQASIIVHDGMDLCLVAWILWPDEESRYNPNLEKVEN
ncbi:hypothetical protein Taro_013571, partial [Colocasia esculenta]|nr:hypothetical protein [Colocasia esculenta]